MTNFTWIDWVIVGAYVVGTGVIGFLCRKYVHDMVDFVVAGRKLDTGMAIATLASTETGLVTVMYFAQEGYTKGVAAFTTGVVFCVGMVIIGLTGFIIKPLRETRVMTIAELYERRYGRGVRVLGGTIIFLAGSLNMGPFLKVGAMFLGTVTGLGAKGDVLALIMTVLLVVVLLYTVLGGMFSVSITDYFQFLVMAAGMAVALCYVLAEFPFSTMVKVSADHYGLESLSPLEAPGMGWTFIAWMAVLWTAACTLWQTGTMRIVSIKSPRLVRRVFVASGLTNAARAILPMLFGLAALAALGPSFLPDDPDGSLKAMPTMLAGLVPTVWLGLLVAGMLAAFMSTHDSYLLGWSAVFVQDVVSPLVPGGLSARTRILISRIVIVVLGGFLLAFGLWYPMSGNVWTYLALTGTVYLSGAFAVVVGALYWRKANRLGAYAAMIAGVAPPVASLWAQLVDAAFGVGEFVGAIEAGLGQTLLQGFGPYELYRTTQTVLSGPTLGFISFVLAAAGMVIVSLWTQRSCPPMGLEQTRVAVVRGEGEATV